MSEWIPLLDRPIHPSIARRFLYWQAIYWGAQIPLLGYVGFFLIFPSGLITPYMLLVLPRPNEVTYIPTLYYTGYWGWAILISYLFYFVHFITTFLLPSRKAFRVMMIILIIAVALNLNGCLMAVNFHVVP